jgi:hypothetical protein
MTASSFLCQSQNLQQKQPKQLRTKNTMSITVTNKSIKGLKWSHAVEAVRALKIRQRNTLDKKKEDLRNHFENLLEDLS